MLDPKQLDRRTIVERKDKVLVGFLEPRVDKVFEFLGILFRNVLRFRSIDVDVVQVPAILVEMAGPAATTSSSM